MATMTAPTPPQTAPQTTPPPDLYAYILSLIDQLEPADRLQLVSDIVSTVQPFVAEAVDDDDDEQLAQEAMEALEYARAHPESLHKWEDVKAELRQMEAAGELPD